MKAMGTKLMLAGLMTISTLAASQAMAEEAPKPEADLTVAAYSTYVWRGFGLSDGSLVVQPGLTVGYNGFGFNLWGNLDTDQEGLESESFNWNETDMTISYDGSAGMVGYSVGYIYYDIDGAAGTDDTEEIYVGVSLDVLLAPSITFYYDIDNLPGWYASLGISHSVPLGEELALDVGASIGFLDSEGDDYSELHDGLISVSMSFPVGDYLSITPELYASFALSSEASDYIEAASVSGDDSYLYGGVSASLSF